ncbi:MAG: AAA family ATPase [Ilumatobacteraceae bacterium]
MGKTHEIAELEFACQPYKIKSGKNLPGDLRDIFKPIGTDGKDMMVCVKRPQKGQPPQFGPLNVTASIRDQSRVLYVSESRTVAAQYPGRRGSILRDLLEVARGEFTRNEAGIKDDFRAKYTEAVDVIRTPGVQDLEAQVQDTARRMLGFMGTRRAQQLELRFGFADPSSPHSALRLMCVQNGVSLPAESLGMGEQSAIVIGMFEAFRQRGTQLNTILLEEPEMYLHPQAQRYLQRLLIELVDEQQAQVILTTHSPIFADMMRYPSIRMVRREAVAGTTCVRIRKPSDLQFLADEPLVRSSASILIPRVASFLFASAVLLVEGHGDRLAALEVARKTSFDLDAEGASVIDCGGKNGIPFYARCCGALGIPFVILHDTDIYKGGDLAEWQLRQNHDAPAQNTRIVTACDSLGSIFTVEPTLESALGVSRSASDKPMRVAHAVRSSDLQDLPAGLTQAVEALRSLLQ